VSRIRMLAATLVALSSIPVAVADTDAQINALQQQLDELKQQMATSRAAAPKSSFNPSTSLILSGQLSNFKRDPADYRIAGFSLAGETDPGPEGFSLAESELVMSANVDDHYFGRFTLSLSPDNEVDIEEAFIQTLALPAGLSLQAGRFYSELGYLNNRHSHQWDFVDQPLVYRAFLGNQYKDDGVQLRWLAPSDTFFELGIEAFRGSNFPAGGAANKGKGSINLFATTGGDVGFSHSWQAGLSYLKAKADARATDGGATRFSGNSDLLAADMVWKWAPQGNNYQQNLVLQLELMQNHEQGIYNIGGDIDSTQSGGYAQVVYQFTHGWRSGVRFDWLDSDDPGVAFSGSVLDAAGHSPKRSSVMLDYARSEFSRWRLQYNHDESSSQGDDQWVLQYTMSLGAHGAHRF